MSNMKFRNPDMLARIEKNPLRKNLSACLDIVEGFQADVDHISMNHDLSTTGRASATDKALRSAIRDLRDAKAPLEELRTKAQLKRNAVKMPSFDGADAVGFLRRQELRTALKAMPVGERQAMLTGPTANQAFVDAAIEQPPTLSGFANNPMETKIFETIQQERLQSLFASQLAEIAELESTIAEADMIINVARGDMAVRAEMQPQQFEQFAKPIETKANAPWLIRGAGDSHTRVVQVENGVASYRPATPDEVRDGKFYKNEAEYKDDHFLR